MITAIGAAIATAAVTLSAQERVKISKDSSEALASRAGRDLRAAQHVGAKAGSNL